MTNVKGQSLQTVFFYFLVGFNLLGFGRVSLDLSQDIGENTLPIESNHFLDVESLSKDQIEKIQTLEHLQRQIQIDLKQVTSSLNMLMEQQKDFQTNLQQLKIELNSLKKRLGPDPKEMEEINSVPITGVFHEIQAGDSLASIAKKFNSRTEYIRKANHIIDPKTLRVGDKIFVPQKNN